MTTPPQKAVFFVNVKEIVLFYKTVKLIGTIAAKMNLLRRSEKDPSTSSAIQDGECDQCEEDDLLLML